MQEILDFLSEVRNNNNRTWFQENKTRFEKIKTRFEFLASSILEKTKVFDDSVRHLELKDCTYRFYRDTRFSKDKTPYKTHFGIYICPGGKKSWESGYYFHIEPVWEDGTGGSGVFCGSFMPDKNMLQLIREDILNDGENYRKVLKKLQDNNFILDRSNALKRLPKGFPSSDYDDLIQLKSMCVVKNIDTKYLLDKNLADKVVKDFQLNYPLVTMLNTAISYTGNY